MRRTPEHERHGGRRIEVAPSPSTERRSYKLLALGSLVVAVAGLVFYPFMPTFGAGAFVLGRVARGRSEADRGYRVAATTGMVVGGAEVAVGLVVTALVLVALVTS